MSDIEADEVLEKVWFSFAYSPLSLHDINVRSNMINSKEHVLFSIYGWCKLRLSKGAA